MLTPIRGYVVDTGGQFTVRLITRAVVHVAPIEGLGLGDVCYIAYDYTRMRVAQVLTEEQYHDAGSPPVEEPVEVGPDEEDADTFLLSSMGLCPVVSL